MNSLELLRRYEPVIHYTEGELFFPCAVEQYVKRCTLMLRDLQDQETLLVQSGHLNIERLGKYSHVPPGHSIYLRFVQKPLEGLEYQRWFFRENKPVFNAPGRLARVGLTSRLLDSFFDLSLLVRGTVPGGTAAAAEQRYRGTANHNNRHVYYARIVREGGYIILHYIFFYAMNNWRSAFYGVNDHEADWEQIFVYLAEQSDGPPTPQWVAFSQHDFHGDNLRRRWDDPELTLVDGTHPVVFAGAGSHASYFRPGEYLMNVQPVALKPIRNLIQRTRKIWTERLGQGESEQLAKQVDAFFSVPFVDYARGDGNSIGPGAPKGWDPILIADDMQWLHSYRGLWGLDTKDPFSGERAPAGPKFNRDGTVRQTWNDPLGWAGLHKVAPPEESIVRLRKHIESVEHELQEIEEHSDNLRDHLRVLEIETRALRETEYLSKLHKKRQEKLAAQEAELHDLYARRIELSETLHATRGYLKQIEQGQWGNPKAHMLQEHEPEEPLQKQSPIVEVWAALSSGLLLLAFALTLIVSPGHWPISLGAVIVVFAVIDTTLHGKLPRRLLDLTIALAGITTAILVVRYISFLALITLIAVARIFITENIRELRGR